MGAKPPDFYMASREGHIIGEPRRCERVRRVRYGQRADCLLVSLSPPLAGADYSVGRGELQNVVLAPRFKGDSLFPPSRWPLQVYVLAPRAKHSEAREAFAEHELVNIAWAELYLREQDIPPSTPYKFGNPV